MRLGVVGCGNISLRYHLPACLETDGVQVGVLMDMLHAMYVLPWPSTEWRGLSRTQRRRRLRQRSDPHDTGNWHQAGRTQVRADGKELRGMRNQNALENMGARSEQTRPVTGISRRRLLRV